MEACFAVALLWGLFGGSHIGLAGRRVRSGLVRTLGEAGYIGLFSVVAAILFTLLVTYYVGHRFDGPPGPGLGRFGLTRWLLMLVVSVAFLIAGGGLASYARAPMALFGANRESRSPRGFERITRHGFFAGVALFAFAHVFLATHLVGVIFFLGLALLPILGAKQQDARLLERRGTAYAEYLSATSFVPFAAVREGRQRVVWEELPWLGLGAALLTALVMREFHPYLLAHGGVWIVLMVLGGAALASFGAWQRAQRRRAPSPAAAEPTP